MFSRLVVGGLLVERLGLEHVRHVRCVAFDDLLGALRRQGGILAPAGKRYVRLVALVPLDARRQDQPAEQRSHSGYRPHIDARPAGASCQAA